MQSHSAPVSQNSARRAALTSLAGNAVLPGSAVRGSRTSATAAIRAALGAGLLVALAICTGCSRSPKERLSGKWIGSRVDHASAQQAESAAPWVKATSWEFAGDKLTISLPAEPPRSGAFRVASIDGPKLTLAVTRPDGQSTDEAVVRLEGDRTMRWSIGDQREVVFVRVAD